MSEKERPLRLHPLSFEEALRAAMQVKPPTEAGEKKKRRGRKKKQPKTDSTQDA